METVAVDHRPAIVKFGIALVILNMLDVFTTHALLNLGGVELNPVAKLFIYSLWLSLAIKTIIPTVVIYRSSLEPTKFVYRSVVGVTIFYALILANNTFHLARHYWFS